MSDTIEYACARCWLEIIRVCHASLHLFAVHLQKTNIHLCPNLFRYGQYTLIITNMTFI